MLKSKDFLVVMKKFFKENIFGFILIGLVTFLSLEKTLSYHFFTDDYAFLYYLGKNLDFGWPYTSVLPMFRPIYNFFGTEPFPYLLLAVITYFIAGIFVYIFSKKLTRNKLIATLSGILFATAYVGLEQFSLIAVSTINNLNVINVCLTLIFLLYYIDTKKPKFYFLTLFWFWISIFLFPYRAYPLVLFLPTLEFIKTFKFIDAKEFVKNLTFLILRYIPFFALASHYGLFTYGTFDTPDSSTNSFVGLFTDPSSKIFSLFNWEFIKHLFGAFGKLIFVKPPLTNDQYFILGLFVFLLILAISLFLILKKKDEGKNILIVLLLTFQSYVGNMFLHVDFAGNGPVNRYLTIAFLPYSILVVLILFGLFAQSEKLKSFNRKILVIAIVLLIIFGYSLLSRAYEKEVIKERSSPAKVFFRELKNYVPHLSDSEYNIFYFDRASYYPIASRFGNVLLSAAMSNSVNLAVPYKVSKESVKIVDTFDQLLKFVIYPPKERKTKYFTFYNDEKGLQDTTSEVFSLLNNGKKVDVPINRVKFSKDGNKSSITIEPNEVISLTPLKVRISLRAILNETFSFENKVVDGVKNRNETLRYLASREKFYRVVKVGTESIHITKLNLPSFLVDKKAETVWLSDQSRWEVKIKPWIKLDLADTRNIGKIIWRELPTRKIEKFTIAISQDGLNWTKLDGSKEGFSFDPDLYQIDFKNIPARFVLITIDELAYGSPGPGLAEIEVIEEEFENVDIKQALRIEQNPLLDIKSNDELANTYEYLRENAKLDIKMKTNRDDPNTNLLLSQLPIYLDGIYHEYELNLPPGGTNLKNLSMEANFPADFFIDRVIFENRKLEELKGEIKSKCEQYANVPEWQNPFDCN